VGWRPVAQPHHGDCTMLVSRQRGVVDEGTTLLTKTCVGSRVSNSLMLLRIQAGTCCTDLPSSHYAVGLQTLLDLTILKESFCTQAKAKRVMERMPWWSAVPSTLESMQGEGVRRDAPNTCSQPVSSSTQGVRQTCANCQQQESEVDTFPRCSRCKVVYYCSSQCQRQAWTAHAPTCTPAATDG
jgi:hypothetical protein